MLSKKVAIVGGGASGLISAVLLKKCGVDAVILERLDRVGKKLISTGNGQGNLTNENLSENRFSSSTANFFLPAINDFGKKEINAFYSDLGIYLKSDPTGKVYPFSKQASSVLDVIRAYLSSVNTEILTDFFVKKIVKTTNGYIIENDRGEQVFSEYLIVACGGKAGPNFGTDGNGYELLKKLDHTVTKTYPSLVQVKTETAKIKSLRGLKADVKLTALDGEKEIKSSYGELLFTEYGISGNAVFSVSGALSQATDPSVKIEFIPDMTDYQLQKVIDRRKELSYISDEDVLIGLVNKMIGRAIVNSSEKDIVKTAKNFYLKVTGTLGYQYAQVTKGGINCSEIDPETMGSKFNKNLYVVGEILDVDGDCGGYNLHWAYASASSAVRDIIKNVKM